MPCSNINRRCMQLRNPKCRLSSPLSWKYSVSKSLLIKDKHLLPRLLLPAVHFYNLSLHLKDQLFNKSKIFKISSEVILAHFSQMIPKA